ncbi:hypothetical protein PENSPDRAFT_228024 [Peniophora sp. CONT]|nr:hypothetical protein PENSPDRAFT_228024 [Peniophora sp. CONT]
MPARVKCSFVYHIARILHPRGPRWWLSCRRWASCHVCALFRLQTLLWRWNCGGMSGTTRSVNRMLYGYVVAHLSSSLPLSCGACPPPYQSRYLSAHPTIVLYTIRGRTTSIIAIYNSPESCTSPNLTRLQSTLAPDPTKLPASASAVPLSCPGPTPAASAYCAGPPPPSNDPVRSSDAPSALLSVSASCN